MSVLRSHLGHPLPDLVAEVRRLLGVDCEVRALAALPAARDWTGAEQLDAFADVVSGYAERATPQRILASVAGLLAYLDAADRRRERLGARPVGRSRRTGSRC